MKRCDEPSPGGRWRCTEPEGHGGRHYALGPPTHPAVVPPLIEANPLVDHVGCWWLS